MKHYKLEHHHQPLAPIGIFVHRVVHYTTLALLLTMLSLLIGMWGYHHFEGLDWTDSLLNAAMILSGMGQVAELHSEGGKIFAAIYALFSGVIFLVIVAVLIVPVFHRIIHRFHVTPER